MTVSAGYAEYPKDAGSFVDLYEYADYALQYAKENGRDCLQLFSQEMLAYRSRELDILRLLKEDISDNFRAFSLKYQPIVEGETKEVIAVEALLQRQNREQDIVMLTMQRVTILQRWDTENISRTEQVITLVWKFMNTVMFLESMKMY